MNPWYLLIICPACFFVGCLLSIRVSHRLAGEREILAQDNIKQAKRAEHWKRKADRGQKLKRRGRKRARG
jgi:hypothetical protein